jgi:hypothetical protein
MLKNQTFDEQTEKPSEVTPTAFLDSKQQWTEIGNINRLPRLCFPVWLCLSL